MPDQPIAVPPGPAPVSYQLGKNEELGVKAAAAAYDGSGAAGPFVPALIIDGLGLTQPIVCPAPLVAAGESATVSWFPSVGGDSPSSGGPFSGARVWNSTTQAIANGAGAGFGDPLNFDTVIFDTDGYADLGAHPTRITIPETGYYYVGGCIAASMLTVSFELQLLIGLNGVTDQIVSDAYATVPSDPSNDALASVSTLYHFTAGDYIELVIAQNNSLGDAIDSIPQTLLCPIFWIGRA